MLCWQLFDKGVEMEVGVQTELFLERPATPVYVPAKTGADAATQIYSGDVSRHARARIPIDRIRLLSSFAVLVSSMSLRNLQTPQLQTATESK